MFLLCKSFSEDPSLICISEEKRCCLHSSVCSGLWFCPAIRTDWQKDSPGIVVGISHFITGALSWALMAHPVRTALGWSSWSSILPVSLCPWQCSLWQFGVGRWPWDPGMAQGVLAADIRPRSGQPHSPQGGVLLSGEPALEMASRHWTQCHPHTCHVRSSPRHNTCHLWERGHRYHHNTRSLWPLAGYVQGPPYLPPPQVSVPHCSTALHALILAFHHHPNMWPDTEPY